MLILAGDAGALDVERGKRHTIELSFTTNWKGKAFAAPKTQFRDLLDRLGKAQDDPAGVYFLFGTDPESGKDSEHIGEAVRILLKQHWKEEFNSAVEAPPDEPS
jgi:hypothetical protein